MPQRNFSPIFDISNDIINELTVIERMQGLLQTAQISENWTKGMEYRAFVREAYHTTHIEGNQLTLEQAEKLLAGGNISDAEPDDIKELLNYREAFNFVVDYINDGAPLTEGVIREIHKKLVDDVRGGRAAPGEYRKIQNYVINSGTGEIVYTPPPVYDVPIMMKDLVVWINSEKDVHPILLSGIAQFQLVHIHPFLDGNGRTSRLLSILCMYKAGYDFKRMFSISEYYDCTRNNFYQAIRSVRKNNMDMTGWLEYFVKGLLTQIKLIFEEKYVFSDYESNSN